MSAANSTIGEAYAQALIELAETQGQQVEQSIYNDLQTVNQSIKQVPEFGVILRHPSVSAAEKKQLLIQLFQGKIQELTLRLIEMLCDKRRLEILPAVEHSYRKLLNERLNIVPATITSAQPLSDEQVNNLKSKLAAKLGKQLEITVNVDQSLIGGVILRVGDEVIDGSIKGKLRILEKSLLSV
jgi:F-type H+-transporting ATPase subunit delta